MRRRILAVSIALMVAVSLSCSGGDNDTELEELRQEIANLRAELVTQTAEPIVTTAPETASPTATIPPTASSTPTPEPTARALSAPQTRYVAGTDGLGVSFRSDCDDSARLSGSWHEGAEIQLVSEGLGACEGWWEAEAHGVRSWVRNTYLADSRPDPATGAAGPEPVTPTPTASSTPTKTATPTPTALVIDAFCDDRYDDAQDCFVGSLAIGIDPVRSWLMWATGVDDWDRVQFGINGSIQTRATLGSALLGLPDMLYTIRIRENRPSGLTAWSDEYSFFIRRQAPAPTPTVAPTVAPTSTPFPDYAAQQCATYQQGYLDGVQQGASQHYLNFLLDKIAQWCQ